MNPYTELFLTCDLESTTPKQVIETLNSLTKKGNSLPSNSFYLALEPGNKYKLTICGELHAEGKAISSFLEWLAPYIYTPVYGEFAGYYQAIDNGKKNTNWIYFQNEEFHLLEIENSVPKK